MLLPLLHLILCKRSNVTLLFMHGAVVVDDLFNSCYPPFLLEESHFFPWDIKFREKLNSIIWYLGWAWWISSSQWDRRESFLGKTFSSDEIKPLKNKHSFFDPLLSWLKSRYVRMWGLELWQPSFDRETTRMWTGKLRMHNITRERAWVLADITELLD